MLYCWLLLIKVHNSDNILHRRQASDDRVVWKEFTTAELPDVEIINKRTTVYLINDNKNYYLRHGIFENFNSHAINIINAEKSNYILLSDCLFYKFNKKYNIDYSAIINIDANSNVLFYRTCAVDISKEKDPYRGIFVYCYTKCQKFFLKDTTIAKCGPNENGKSCIFFARDNYDNIVRFSLDRVNLTKNKASATSAIDLQWVDGEVKYTTIDSNYAAMDCIIYHIGSNSKYSYCNLVNNVVKSGLKRLIWNNNREAGIKLSNVYVSQFQGTAFYGNIATDDTPRDRHPSLSYLKSYECFAFYPIDVDETETTTESITETEEDTTTTTESTTETVEDTSTTTEIEEATPSNMNEFGCEKTESVSAYKILRMNRQAYE